VRHRAYSTQPPVILSERLTLQQLSRKHTPKLAASAHGSPTRSGTTAFGLWGIRNRPTGSDRHHSDSWRSEVCDSPSGSVGPLLARRVELEALAFAFPISMVFFATLGLLDVAMTLDPMAFSLRNVWLMMPMLLLHRPGARSGGVGKNR
jgi:hypothetical protein